MKRWAAAGLFVLMLSPFSSQVLGDLLPGPGIRPGIRPVPPPVVNPFQPGAGRPLPVRTKLVVKVSDKYKVPVLQVPVNLALGQRANPAGGFGEAPEANPEPARRAGLPTIVSGLALTLAFASGGLWLVRRGARRTLAILVLTGLFAAGTAFVWADIAPRPGVRPRPVAPPPAAMPALKLPAGLELGENLIIEPMPAGDHVTLIVPKASVIEKEKPEKEAAPRERRTR